MSLTGAEPRYPIAFRSRHTGREPSSFLVQGLGLGLEIGKQRVEGGNIGNLSNLNTRLRVQIRVGPPGESVSLADYAAAQVPSDKG